METKTLNPEFHEIFDFPLTGEELLQRRLVLQVWDQDVIDRDDLMGEMIVELSDLPISPSGAVGVHTGWYSLSEEVWKLEGKHI